MKIIGKTFREDPIRTVNVFDGPKKISLSLPNEIQKSTRQFTLSTGQALCPLVRLVRLDDNYTGSLANKTRHKISKSP